MPRSQGSAEQPAFLSTQVASRREEGVALAAILVSAAIFFGELPLAKQPLAPVTEFITGQENDAPISTLNGPFPARPPADVGLLRNAVVIYVIQRTERRGKQADTILTEVGHRPRSKLFRTFFTTSPTIPAMPAE